MILRGKNLPLFIPTAETKKRPSGRIVRRVRCAPFATSTAILREARRHAHCECDGEKIIEKREARFMTEERMWEQI